MTVSNGADLSKAETSVKVLEAIVDTTLDAFDLFVGACIDADGKPKAPDRAALMRARSMLPPRCPHALKKD